MRAFVSVTDYDWFRLLRDSAPLDEINFWQPSGKTQFKALKPGELFLFKLHSPKNYIVGGGIFAHSSILPISLAWESFGISNGAQDFIQMRNRVAKYRKEKEDRLSDYFIGCILLEQPFFFPENQWIPVPSDWSPSIVQGKGYDLTTEPGLSLWNRLKDRVSVANAFSDENENPKYGKPSIILPRLGQGSFRVIVTDAYERRCAISRERTLPALDASHIKPYAEVGNHSVNNGILLRKDMHALFDKGYLTITPESKVEVSSKIREEFENGKDYYKHNGSTIYLPQQIELRPSPEYLRWHNEEVYRG